jgi:two-component system, NtrC family, response regulator HydG
MALVITAIPIHHRDAERTIVIGKKTILIVDDEVLITSLLCKYLSKRGYHVKAVTSPERALLMTYDEQFDLIISDVRMVPISGVQIAAQLKHSGFTGKIIMMSSCFGRFEKELRDLNVDALLEKPFELSDLLEVISA